MQPGRSLPENVAELPRACSWGSKTNSQGKKESWKGYKLHLDCIDGDIPISAILTSASLHDVVLRLEGPQPLREECGESSIRLAFFQAAR